MASLRDRFEHFNPQDEVAEGSAIRTGLVVPDTNVLLNLYRFQAGARDKLFGALATLNDRLWIPHQVALEFHRRRLDVMKDQEQYFTNTQREIKALISEIRNVTDVFPTRIGLNEDRAQEIRESISSLSSLLSDEITKARNSNEVRLRDRDSDGVLERLDALLGDRIGDSMAPAELKEARREAMSRVEARIPPGFEDGSKADPTGDYLIFRQLMDEARKQSRPVMFITDDEKRDWYRRQQDIPFGARAELREEMMAAADVPLVIVTTDTFLSRARKYLGFDVSDKTIAQAKELPSIIEENHQTADALENWVLLANMTDTERARSQALIDSYIATHAAAFSEDQKKAINEAAGRAFVSQLAKARVASSSDWWRRKLEMNILQEEVAAGQPPEADTQFKEDSEQE
jgi:PIN like domain